MRKGESKATVTRKEIDNPYKRNTADNSYKNRHFDDKRVGVDEYTGGKIFYSSTGADAPAGAPRHFTTDMTANTDHITPLDVLIERYGDKIPIEDLRLIANSDYNLAMTNEALNKRKGKQANIKYLLDQLEKENPENAITTLRMIAAQLKSETMIQFDITKVQIRSSTGAIGNVAIDVADATWKTASAAVEAGVSTALVSLTVSGLHNLAKVASGEKNLEDALKDVASDTASSFVSGAGLKVTQDLVSGIANAAGAEQIANIVAGELPSAEIAAAVMTAKCVKMYLDGKMTGEECAVQILANGAGVLAYQLGMAMGGPAGAFVASIITSQITNTILEYRQEKKIRKSMDAEVSRVLSAAEKEILNQQAILKEYVTAELKRWDDTIDDGFAQIQEAIGTQEAWGVSYGLSKILNLFNAKVIYSSLDEFDKDFYGLDTPPLIL